MTAPAAHGGRWAALLALVCGLAFVAAFDAALAPVRYPYSGDSASYVEMAASLKSAGRPLVTPWDLAPGDRDAVPQPLFPPGFALLIAAVTPPAGEVRAAALWPARVAAALLPLVIVLLFRGAAPAAAVLGVALYALLSPGVRDWQFIAYSDVPALVLAVVALGALARGLGYLGAAPRRDAPWLLAAGFAAGLAYGLRNAGLGLLAASAATLGWAAWRARPWWRPPLWWGLGAAAPLAALLAYNLATFGQLRPYFMPPSARAWPLNVGDYARAQLTDLGVPPAPLGAVSPLVAVAVLALLAAFAAAAWWRLRRDPARQGLLTLLGAYVTAGAVLLVASRSRYEWGGLIDVRNTLQYSWALALALVIAAGVLLPARAQRALAVGALLLLASLVAAAGAEVAAARRTGPESWLVLTEDRAVMGAARALPPGTLIASNTGVLFRLGASRAARQLDVGGDDADFLGSLRLLARAAGPRPAAFLLVCNEWTWAFSACGARRAGVVEPACVRVRGQPPIVAVCRPPAVALNENGPPPVGAVAR